MYHVMPDGEIQKCAAGGDECPISKLAGVRHFINFDAAEEYSKGRKALVKLKTQLDSHTAQVEEINPNDSRLNGLNPTYDPQDRAPEEASMLYEGTKEIMELSRIEDEMRYATDADTGDWIIPIPWSEIYSMNDYLVRIYRGMKNIQEDQDADSEDHKHDHEYDGWFSTDFLLPNSYVTVKRDEKGDWQIYVNDTIRKITLDDYEYNEISSNPDNVDMEEAAGDYLDNKNLDDEDELVYMEDLVYGGFRDDWSSDPFLYFEQVDALLDYADGNDYTALVHHEDNLYVLNKDLEEAVIDLRGQVKLIR